MKIYGHKVGELYKPYKGSHTDNEGELSLLFLLLHKHKSHYCFQGVGSVEEMIDKAGICMTPDEDGFIWGRKIGKGRFCFHHYDEDDDFEDYYECNLTRV